MEPQKNSYYTLKNKGSILASMVLQRTLNIHGTFQTQKRLFIVKKGSLDFENVLQNGSSMASLQKHPFETFNFKSVVEKWFFYHVAKLFF